MDTRNRRIRPRLLAFAAAAFGLGAALAATPRCEQCIAGYYDCRAAGFDYDSCRNDLMFCQRANHCPMVEPPEI
ncbi:hypothetical protein RDV84_23325 [Lysobacter yananisis]|uniref:Lipoprotein n=1 Tax=Lysobacter yananisis TaxID=1003114 RepID=A0ABY9P721_9GAMM|nr:hypothetical protein [Lysobacter yananisis]WMT02858.1 hypothetical protein RDV84_23325 [Lysobacter yananisis]